MHRTPIRLAAVLLAALLALALVSGCSFFKGKEFDETEGWNASKLYAEAASEMDSGNYKRAIELYEKLEARFPFGRYAMQAQLDVAYANYKAEEPEAAIAATMGRSAGVRATRARPLRTSSSGISSSVMRPWAGS